MWLFCFSELESPEDVDKREKESGLRENIYTFAYRSLSDG